MMQGPTGPSVESLPLPGHSTPRREASPEGLLREIARLVALRLGPELLFEAMAEGLRELVLADRASLALYDPDRDHFEIVALALHQGSRFGKGWTIPHHGSQVGRVFDSGKPFVTVHGASPILYESRPLAEEGMQSAVLIPMVSEGRTIGTFNTDLRRVRKRTTDEIDSLVKVAGQIAVAVATSGGLHRLTRERTAGARGPSPVTVIDSTEAANILLANCPSLNVRSGKLMTFARAEATVLITGETGTGKGVLAQALHAWSARRRGPFVKCDCAALAPSLVESELFGHERGAFTGAEARRIGRFEAAHKGTLFLDEVGELPLELQAKLLGVLDDRQLLRLGGTIPVRVDVRVIAATNRDLRADVTTGRFRADLFYRLNVLRVDLPPLRERPDDIVPLAEHFVRTRSASLGYPMRSLGAAAIEILTRYSWPGNVRELANAIERAIVLGDDVLDVAPETDALSGGPPLGSRVFADERLASLAEVEKRYIARVLKATGGRIAGPHGAALILGLPPNTLRSRMTRLNIRRDSD